MKPLCKHCETRNAWKSRGLCWTCFRIPGVRSMYPLLNGRVLAVRGSGLDVNGGYTLPPEPTAAPVGSEEKIRVLTERAAAGVGLFHPQDNPETGDLCEHSSTHPARLGVKRRSRQPSQSDPMPTGCGR